MDTFFEPKNSFNQAELEQLMNDLYKQMFIVAYSIVRDKSEAMDIVQESWVKILQKIDTLKEREKIMNWAKVITHHTAINYVRRKNIHTLISVCETAAGYEPSTASEVEDIVLRKVISDCMNLLDKETRDIITYKFYGGLKDKEIADKLGLPVGTVKAKLHRGKEKLKTFLVDTYKPVKENN